MKTVGTIGGGQLAMMLAEAGKALDIELLALVNDLDCPAQYTATLVKGDQQNVDDVAKFLQKIDVLTFEFENVDFTHLLNAHLPIYPNIYALKIAQDRETEKDCFELNSIPTVAYEIVYQVEELQAAIDKIGLPCVIKTCRDGYDGKGQLVLKEPLPAAEIWQTLGNKRLIVEKFIQFDREVSLLAVGGQHNEFAFYPLTENQHHDGILRISTAPYENTALQAQAEKYAKRLIRSLHYVGVLTIEFFVVGDILIANEMAPRVHNSGHWTIEGAETSQFENHLRAITGMPLRSTALKAPARMINFIGALPDLTSYENNPQATIHLYHKSSRPGRKLGHVTILVTA